MSDTTGRVLSCIQEQLLGSAALVSGYAISWTIPDDLADADLDYVATLGRLAIFGLSASGYLKMRQLAGDRFQGCFMMTAMAPLVATVLFIEGYTITWLIQVLPLTLACSMWICTLGNLLCRAISSRKLAVTEDVQCEEGIAEKLIDDGC